MKKRNLIIMAAFIFAIGSAIANNSPAHKFTTLGKYWDSSVSDCVEGESTFSCATNNMGNICTDNVTGGTSRQLRDGSSSTNPCGVLLRRP